MTVSTQLKQTVASLKSAQGNLEAFALQTQNQQAKQLFTNSAQQAKAIVDSLEQRVSQIEGKEPQYKGF